MDRRTWLLTAAAAASAGMGGCAKKVEPVAVREISVSLSEHLALSPVYLADELGLFSEAGFVIKRVRLSARDAIPVLAGGKLDVTFGGVSAPLMTAVANQMAIRIVAGREYVNPGCGDSFALYARRSIFGSGTPDPRKLRGKRVSVRVRGIGEMVLDVFLKQHGIPLTDVTKVDLPLNEALAALESGRIDALMDLEVARSPLAVSGQIVRLWSYADAQPGQQISFALFGKSMLEDPAGSARFLAALLEGGRRFLSGDTPAFMTEFASRYSLNLEDTVKACRKTFAEDGAVDLASVRRSFAWQYERGYATTPLTPEQLVDTRYLNEARRMLVNGAWRIRPRAAAKKT